MSQRYKDYLDENPGTKRDDVIKALAVDYEGFRKSKDKKVIETEIRTKQSFKESTDINKILKKAQTAGSISHLIKYPEGVYGEFDGEFSLLDATEKIAKARGIFDELPSEIRKDFNNNALEFVRFAGDPANNGKLRELLPAIAEPGAYFPNPVQRGGVGAGAATAPSVEEPSGVQEPANPPASAPEPPSESGGGAD